jgi:hypothetical protein
MPLNHALRWAFVNFFQIFAWRQCLEIRHNFQPGVETWYLPTKVVNQLVKSLTLNFTMVAFLFSWVGGLELNETNHIVIDDNFPTIPCAE